MKIISIEIILEKNSILNLNYFYLNFWISNQNFLANELQITSMLKLWINLCDDLNSTTIPFTWLISKAKILPIVHKLKSKTPNGAYFWPDLVRVLSQIASTCLIGNTHESIPQLSNRHVFWTPWKILLPMASREIQKLIEVEFFIWIG